jgi:hypothetical protein
MAITKAYDEMADRWTYIGTLHKVRDEKNGFGEVWLQAQFIDMKDGGDMFWLVAVRKAQEWHWLDNTSFILLIDGKRFTGVGRLANSEVTQETGWFEDKIICNEEIHCGGKLEIINLLAKSQIAKFRLKDVDFVLPAELIVDVKEIATDLEKTGGYGK